MKDTQPVAWQRLERQGASDPEERFYKAFENAVEADGLVGSETAAVLYSPQAKPKTGE